MLKLSIARIRNQWIRKRLQGRKLAPLAYENLHALDHLDLKQRAKSLRYVILDLETTGLSLTSDRVISLSAVRMVDGHILLGDVFSSLVNPGRSIPFSTIKIHGIMPSMVARAPALDEVFDQFLLYLGSDIIVGYHVRFDLFFLNKCMKRKYGMRMQNLALDAMFMCKKVIIPAHIRSYAGRSKGDQDLDSVAKHFGIEIPERHTALGDALATAMIFQRILADLEKSGPADLRSLLSAGRIN